MSRPAKSAIFSRLEMESGLCFVEVTLISNRNDSRLEIWGGFLSFVGVTRGVELRVKAAIFRLEFAAG